MVVMDVALVSYGAFCAETTVARCSVVSALHAATFSGNLRLRLKKVAGKMVPVAGGLIVFPLCL